MPQLYELTDPIFEFMTMRFSKAPTVSETQLHERVSANRPPWAKLQQTR